MSIKATYINFLIVLAKIRRKTVMNNNLKTKRIVVAYLHLFLHLRSLTSYLTGIFIRKAKLENI